MATVPDVLVLYGTQTGNAEEIAKLAEGDIKKRGLSVETKAMDAFLAEHKAKGIDALPTAARAMVFVISTTGQGDPPDHARKFTRLVRMKKDPAFFKNVPFSVLGLGDTNYDNFCDPAKKLFKALENMGGLKLHPLRLGDDATGLEAVVTPWRKEVADALHRQFTAPASNGAAAAAAAVKTGPPLDVLLLYGTQTGNAEDIAKLAEGDIRQRCKDLSPALELETMAMDAFLQEHKAKGIDALPTAARAVVCVISTTGQGDPPDHARKFTRLVRMKKDPAFFKNVPFSVLGLGDTNYDNFCDPAKKLFKALENMGGLKLHPLRLADDATGLEEVVMAWRKEVTDAIYQLFASAPAAPASAPATAANGKEERKEEAKQPQPQFNAVTKEGKVKVEKPKGLPRLPETTLDVSWLDTQPSSPCSVSSFRWNPADTEALLRGYTPEAPFLAKLTAARYLSTESSGDRHVLHVELELPSDVCYQPGDAIGVHCPNHPTLVKGLVERLGLSPSRVFTLTAKTPAAKNATAPPLPSSPTADSGSGSVPVPALNGTAPVPAPAAKEGQEEGSDGDGSAKAAASVAARFPHIKLPCTVQDVLTYCVDVTSAPKKSFLRLLAEACFDPRDKEKLYLLACPAGKPFYEALIEKGQPNLLDLLKAFPSCLPSLPSLLEHLPRLQPRYYSISSAPALHPSTIHFAATIVHFPVAAPPVAAAAEAAALLPLSGGAMPASLVSEERRSRRKKGLCTNWMLAVCERAGLLSSRPLLPEHKEQHGTGKPSAPLPPGSYKQPDGRVAIPVFMRRATDFTLPADLSLPVIMVGPGTGVAPFRSFLQARKVQLQALGTGGAALGWWRGLEVDQCDVCAAEDEHTHSGEEKDEASGRSRSRSRESGPRRSWSPARQLRDASLEEAKKSSKPGEMVLFFGCRHKEHDYIYGPEFESLHSDGTLTHFFTAFSRQHQQHHGSTNGSNSTSSAAPQKVYVQTRLREQGRMLANLVLQKRAQFYVCGDGRAMAVGVQAALESVLAEHGGMSKKEAQDYVLAMKREKRYITDQWS